MPKRIQLSRAKGWRKPEGAVVVSRPSKWGNPYKVGGYFRIGHSLPKEIKTPAQAVMLFALMCEDSPAAEVARRELRGRDLACWCPLHRSGVYVPCHADVLLSLANGIPLEDVVSENLRRAKGEAA